MQYFSIHVQHKPNRPTIQFFHLLSLLPAFLLQSLMLETIHTPPCWGILELTTPSLLGFPYLTSFNPSSLHLFLPLVTTIPTSDELSFATPPYKTEHVSAFLCLSLNILTFSSIYFAANVRIMCYFMVE